MSSALVSYVAPYARSYLQRQARIHATRFGKYALHSAKFWASNRIRRFATKMYKSQSAKARRAMRNTFANKNTPDVPENLNEDSNQAGTAIATVTLSDDTLHYETFLNKVASGGSGGTRERNFIDVRGLKFELNVRNTNDFAVCFNVAVIIPKLPNLPSFSPYERFFTKPVTTGGYVGIDYNDATILNSDFKNTLPIFKGNYYVLYHRKFHIASKNVGGAGSGETCTIRGRDQDVAYIRKYIKYDCRHQVNSSYPEGVRPPILCYWWLPINQDNYLLGPPTDLKMNYHIRCYFKDQ